MSVVLAGLLVWQFMLHNPNPNINVTEVAETFREIKDAGKARAFGISNFHIAEYEPLKAGKGSSVMRALVVHANAWLYRGRGGGTYVPAVHLCAFTALDEVDIKLSAHQMETSVLHPDRIGDGTVGECGASHFLLQ